MPRPARPAESAAPAVAPLVAVVDRLPAHWWVPAGEGRWVFSRRTRRTDAGLPAVPAPGGRSAVGTPDPRVLDGTAARRAAPYRPSPDRTAKVG